LRSSFSSMPTKTLTLVRDGGESVTLEIRPYPASYGTWLKAEFPPPSLMVTSRAGKNRVTDTDKLSEYNDLYVFCLVAKSLGDQLDTKRETFGKGKAGWLAFAKAVLEEFRAANFTDGEINEIGTAVATISSSVTIEDEKEDDPGN